MKPISLDTVPRECLGQVLLTRKYKNFSLPAEIFASRTFICKFRKTIVPRTHNLLYGTIAVCVIFSPEPILSLTFLETFFLNPRSAIEPVQVLHV